MNILVRSMKLEVEIFERLHLNSRINQKLQDQFLTGFYKKG